MAILLTRDRERILGDVLSDVATSTGLTRTSPGSKVRAILEAFSKEMGRLYTQMDVNLVQSFLSGAQDRYLDFFGDLLGMQRLGPENAQIDAAHKNLKWYVESGTFGSINNSASILLPAGTLIGTLSAARGIQYKLPYNVLLPAGSNIIYSAAETLRAGSLGNVGANTLIYHNFNNYSDYLNDTLKVTNLAEINTGHEAEDNENYRYRLSNALVSSEKANSTAIRLAALSVSGVADVILIPYHRGLGSSDIIIKSVSPQVTTPLINTVQSIINATIAHGVLPTVRGPKETGMSFEIVLKLNQVVSDDVAAEIITIARQAVINYINNLDIAEAYIVNEVVQRVMETDNRIMDMGTVVNQPLENVYIYKDTRLEDNKIRTKLVGNYQPIFDERLIIETEEVTSDPVSITIEGQ